MQLMSVTIQDEPLDMDDEPPRSEMLSAASTVSSSRHSSVSSSLHDEPPLSEISEHSTVPSSLETNLLRDTVMHTQSHSLCSQRHCYVSTYVLLAIINLVFVIQFVILAIVSSRRSLDSGVNLHSCPPPPPFSLSLSLVHTHGRRR